MRRSHPPLLATWLLEHLVSSGADESFVGDLLEEYAHGHSRAWYWGQVLCAIWISFWAELRANSLLTIKAVITGWLAARLLEFAALRIMIRLHISPPIESLPLAVRNDVAFGLNWLVLWTLVWVGSGWFMGRLYQRQLTTVAMAFSISVFAWKLQGFAWTLRLLLGAAADPRYFLQFMLQTMTLILPPICVALGALIASRTEQQQHLRHVS